MHRNLIIVTFALVTLTAACSPYPEIETTSAVAFVNSDLLGDNNYTGEGTFTVIEAQQAYNADEDATAVAARITVPGNESLCLFWYVGGELEGLIIGDTVTREYSVWSFPAAENSPANQTVVRLKATDEGKAVLFASGCGPGFTIY